MHIEDVDLFKWFLVPTQLCIVPALETPHYSFIMNQEEVLELSRQFVNNTNYCLSVWLRIVFSVLSKIYLYSREIYVELNSHDMYL